MADTNQHIYPRSILNLFGLAAQKQLIDSTPTSTPLRPFNMETVMGKVSEFRIRDLSEEYKHLASVFIGLTNHLAQMPILEKALITALSKIIKENNIKSTYQEIITELIRIGVLYVYNYHKKDAQLRYHTPDLYLWGLNLRRGGPGAYQDLIKKKLKR
ncbi:MAG: hypothetical protein U5L45_20980 [Saprospiraceae bacterium]|nr:hypothetical protein [Saprospiraceae bacterium]